MQYSLSECAAWIINVNTAKAYQIYSEKVSKCIMLWKC